ncbi:MAG TPA: HlyD family efflux transporter periplasmic adaptor subunit [Thermoanaerobaculia bacterium]|nr:HlyD family efflux transporter periplasmic adaptor subunit [Thermoanaerobaculia bacterium]
MATPFERTLRTLKADRFRVTATGLAIAAAFVLVWMAWMALARVSIRETSAAARIEIARRSRPVESVADGVVAAIEVQPGARVRAGAPLVRLATVREEHAIAEHEAELRGVIAEGQSIRNEILTAERSLESERQGVAAAVARARAEASEKSAPAMLARAENARLERLAAQGLISASELDRGRVDERVRSSASDAARAALSNIEQDLATRVLERQARIRELESALSRVDARRAGLEAALSTARFERDQRIIRAPLDGVVAEVAALAPGQWIEEGESLAVIVPESRELQVVAFFAPASIGRIRAGQTARLRLDAYPSAEYGTLAAVVQRVAGEVRDGRVRVELTIAAARMPVEHGMTGSAEIEVERISPAALLLRIAGGWEAR